jgi:hypothetical protein
VRGKILTKGEAQYGNSKERRRQEGRREKRRREKRRKEEEIAYRRYAKRGFSDENAGMGDHPLFIFSLDIRRRLIYLCASKREQGAAPGVN